MKAAVFRLRGVSEHVLCGRVEQQSNSVFGRRGGSLIMLGLLGGMLAYLSKRSIETGQGSESYSRGRKLQGWTPNILKAKHCHGLKAVFDYAVLIGDG